jgi:hypothetical protein
MPRRLLAAAFATVVFTACAEPPSKEMNQAQGAIDAAKAAGAETYAPRELAAATEALRKSEEAVTQRDYRLALSHAIESREQATAAAKAAVDGRAKARGDVERHLAEVTALVKQAEERLARPDVAKLSRRSTQDAQTAVDAARKSLQTARTALNGDDYAAARTALDDVTTRIQKANSALDAAIMKPAPARKRR